MDDVISISSDSSDTIILSAEENFSEQPKSPDIDPDIESLVKKYISEERYHTEDNNKYNGKKDVIDNDLSAPLTKRVKKSKDNSPIFSESSSSQEETTNEIAALQMLAEKYKHATDNSAKENMLPLSNKEILRREKELQKQKKIEERLQKKKEAEQEKCIKQALAAANKNSKRTECMKFIIVGIDNDITNEEYGNEVISALQEADVQYKIQSQIFPRTITWTRKVQSHLVNDSGQLVLTSNEEEADEVLLIMNCKEFVEHISNNTLCGYIQSLKSVLINKKITLVIYGLHSYHRYFKNRKQNEMRALITDENKKPKTKTFFDDFPKVTKKSIEFGLTQLQLLCSCSHRLIDSAPDLGLLVSQFTKAVAEIPYKLQKDEKLQQTDWFATGDNRDSVKVDKNGNGLNRLWKQMLTTFPLARLETAEAICLMYPTISSLMTAYESCVSSKEAELLLQDIPIRRAAGPLSSTRKIGPELSKKIYNFLTSIDGDILL